MMEKKQILKMLGEALLYSSINVSLGSVEMSSKFSVRSFSKDQETLDSASNALADYVLISTFWTIGVACLMFAKYGLPGLISGIIANTLITAWIILSYRKAFQTAVTKYGLVFPKFNLLHWNLAE